MTNEAISKILDYVYSETRSFAEANFAIKDLLKDVPMDSAQRNLAAAGTASADRLLRTLDDVRVLESHTPAVPAAIEGFDLGLCVSEIVEALNLASGKRQKQIVLESSNQPSFVTQDRRFVEQMLTRVLGTALKLARPGDEPLILSLAAHENGVRLGIRIGEAYLAHRLVKYLNAGLDTALMESRGDVPFGVALMVAGKQLRALGGEADSVDDSDPYYTVALDLPWQAPGQGQAASGRQAQPCALNILVVEDNDESFALTEFVLDGEQLWRARDGQAALSMVQKQRFDVVFMDIHMPGMDGYEVIRNMRNWETQTGKVRTPMVVLSSDDLETQQRSAAEFGCSGFLRKPLQRLELVPLFDRLK